MRKLILISALLLASASAQAGPSAGPLLAAAADTPAPTSTDLNPRDRARRYVLRRSEAGMIRVP